jgi:hypothetical protein
MNVYIVELAKRLAAIDIEVEILTRATSAALPPSVELAPGALVRHVCSTSITFRLDSVFAYVNINTDGSAAADAKVLNSVTRMFAQRIRQAQYGQSPSARAT